MFERALCFEQVMKLRFALS